MCYRLIYSNFWTDPTTMEEMTQEERYFYLYLLTNPSTTSCGIYSISKRRMSFELGYDMDAVESYMDRFENTFKLIKFNPKTRELAIKNWGKYNLNKGGKPWMDCLISELTRVKDKTLIAYVMNNIKSEAIKEVFRTFTDPSTDRERAVPRQVDNTGTSTNTNTNTGTGAGTDNITAADTETASQPQPSELDNEESSLNAETEDRLQRDSISILQEYEKLTGHVGVLNFDALKLAVAEHGQAYVRSAIKKALERGNLKMQYINGILKSWAREGYPKEVRMNGNGSFDKNHGQGKNQYAGFKPREPGCLDSPEYIQVTEDLI